MNREKRLKLQNQDQVMKYFCLNIDKRRKYTRITKKRKEKKKKRATMCVGKKIQATKLKAEVSIPERYLFSFFVVPVSMVCVCL